jgi:peptidoglycan/xylan/chitin deacetylase (PgdA/CDA1 family)
VIASAGRRKRLAAVLPVGALARRVARRRRLVGVLNLHSVPPRCEQQLRALLDNLRRTFVLGDPFDLERAARKGCDRATLFLTFDDGLANHFDVLAPVLEEHDARAIFCVPVDFLDTPSEQQLRWFREHVYPQPTELHGDADVAAMTWEQVRELAARGHRICSHGCGHVPLGPTVPRAVVEREVVASRSMLEERTGVSVDGFCWPVQAPIDVDPWIRSTYAYALAGSSRRLVPPHDLHRIFRTNIEVSWPRRLIDLQLARMALR